MAAKEIEHPPVFRPAGQTYSAKPICRSHAERHGFDARHLHPFPSVHRCEVEKCDGQAAYLLIDC